MDPFLGDVMLDRRKTREGVAELQEAVRKLHETVGRRAIQRLFAPRGEGPAQEVVITRDELLEKAEGKAPYAYRRDQPMQTLKDLQIRLASITDEAATEAFVAELRELRETLGPQLEEEIRRERARHGDTPMVMVALKVLQRNPRVRELLDINYWHGRIGPALTDTMFVVLLQGLHLPFLLSTSDRVMSGAPWFTGLPLRAREVISIVYNNALGMFVDNWADCVAHARWLTSMYLGDLTARVVALAGDLPEVEQALRAGHFEDDPTRLVPERFKTRVEQLTVLFGVLERRHPGEAGRLEAARQALLETAQGYFFSSMLIAMTISVVGAGKSLPGDSTHFTFAAGEKDFTLAVTLKDFVRHPFYHVWELIFSGAYAMFAGPLLAERLVAPGFSKLGIGSGFFVRVETLMREEFRALYPGLAEQFERLDAELRAAHAGPNRR
jgi:hypothetical protein